MMLHKIDVDQKELVFVVVPGHVGIRGYEAAADRSAKEALDQKKKQTTKPDNNNNNNKNPYKQYPMPFWDLKPLTVKHISSLAKRMG